MTDNGFYYLFKKKQKQRIYECHSSIWLAPDGFVYRRGSFIASPVCSKTRDISVFKPNNGPSQAGKFTWNWIESKTILWEVIVSGICQSWVTEKHPGPCPPKKGNPLLPPFFSLQRTWPLTELVRLAQEREAENSGEKTRENTRERAQERESTRENTR